MNVLASDVSSKCENAFSIYREASCIVYNDVQCEDDGFGIGLMDGAKRNFGAKTRINNVSVKNNVKALSIKQGCSLQMWTGIINCYVNLTN